VPRIEDIILNNINLKKIFYRAYNWLCAFGFEPVKFIRSVRGLDCYFSDYFKFKNQNKGEFALPLKMNAPCLHDRFDVSGTARGGYFFGDLYVAQEIYQNNPRKHVDIASRVDGLVAHIATFRKIEVFDIRKLEINIPNIQFTQVDFMTPKKEYINYCDSLSCLHALEHFGLGRYGDPIDHLGHIKGLNSIAQILEKNGILYLGLPIGDDRIDFNAHRVFSIKTILSISKDHFNLINIKVIDDFGYPIDKEPTNDLIEKNFGCHYGFGIFKFQKKQ
jgi:hypothetical protein